MVDELSQNEIDKLFDSKDSTSEDDKNINNNVKELLNILNTSLEEVFKMSFSLEIVSKFVELTVVPKEEIPVEDRVFIFVEIRRDDKFSPFFISIEKKFASVLADLMLMGPGEAKDELTEDDLDAVKELFSQVFGNLSVAAKEHFGFPILFEVKKIEQKLSEFENDEFYNALYDVAIPNIESDVVQLFVHKKGIDALFYRQTEEQYSEEPQEVPFKEVETEFVSEEKEISKVEAPPKNLDLIMDIELEVKIRIGEKYMLIKDVLNLRDGSIIELDKSIDEPMDILVNGKVVARGVVVVVGGKFGIKITHIETREERIKSLGG